MPCSKCGSQVQASAGFCQACGAKAGDMHQIELWNPNAVANWSLILTPAFGAYLQMQNWRSLGEPRRATESQIWFYTGLGLLVVYMFIGALVDRSDIADGLARLMGIVFLISWYFAAGRAQGKYVKEKFGDTYQRKPWAKALALSALAVVGYFIVAASIGAIVGHA